MPRKGAQSAGLKSGSTPSSSSSPTPAGITPSPQALSGGDARRSSTTVERPRRAVWMAIASPAGPPPAIATSTFTAELDLGIGQRRLDQLARESHDVHRLRRLQLIGQEAPQRFPAPHFAARGAGQRPRLEDLHRV